MDGLSVIFIDDELAILDAIGRAAHRRFPKWKVQCISNPINALTVFQEQAQSIQVLVCDIHMPEVSGVRIMQAVRSVLPHVSIIALSGQLDAKSIVGANKYADVCLCKPVDTNIIFDAIIALRARKE